MWWEADIAPMLPAMRFALILSATLLMAGEAQCHWLRLSDTDQGPRFVNLASIKRTGDQASVDTELRMAPALRRREHFKCSKRLMLVDLFGPANVHDPALRRVGKSWASVKDIQDGPTMLKVACTNVR
jgi:hypothetical protein